MKAALLIALLLPLAGCERVMRNMYEQPRLDRGEASPLFADGQATRPPPDGSVPHALGEPAATSSGRRGADRAAAADEARRAQRLPQPLDRGLLLRGQDRYGIYCLPCHGATGEGNGLVVQRGFPAPPSYHIERLRQAGDRYFYDVITQGHGVMFGYADRIEPQDRWAVVAYLRALQLSQHAEAAQLPPALRQHLPPAPEAPR